MYIDIKTIQRKRYQEFVSFWLKKAQYVIITTIDDDFPALFGETISLPGNIDYHTILLSENEHIYCFNNRYYATSLAFSQYSSMKDFLDYNNIYRLMFANETEVVAECMEDGIIIY